MPRKLIDMLHSHKNAGKLKQRILVTTFGMSEERSFIENLSHKAGINVLAIEYQPNPYTDSNKLTELLYYHRRLFLDHPKMDSLSIDMVSQPYGQNGDIFQMQPFERLPPINKLSLASYTFNSQGSGLHVNLQISALTSLTLDKCRRMDYLFHEFSLRNAALKELKICRPIWREGAPNREHQRAIFQHFLDRQNRLEVLELQSFGFSSSILSMLIHEEGRSAHIRSISLCDLDHQLRTSTRDHCWGRSAAFKSLCAEDIRQFRQRCPKLTDLQFDLAMDDFHPVQ